MAHHHGEVPVTMASNMSDMAHHDHHAVGPTDAAAEAIGGDHDMHAMHNMPDHRGHGMTNTSCVGHDMMMQMYFTAGYNVTVLFKEWHIDSIGGLIGSMIGIFIMAALYEGLKYYREYLFRKTYQSIEYSSVSGVANDKGPEGPKVVAKVSSCQHAQTDCVQCPSAVDMCQIGNEPSAIPYNYLFGFHVTRMLSGVHLFQTLLHVVQVVLSYFLMLIFMTYNVWLCAAVALGAAFGYFVFGWKKSVVVDITEHCH